MAPFPATRRVALAAALLASILLFFVALWVIFRGHIPHVSQRASVHQRELELTLAPLSEALTRMEGGAREFVDRMDPSRFLKTAAAPRPAPPPPARKGKGAHKAAPRPAPAPIPTPSFDGILPAA
ncbi:MAG: hypothetical protein J0L75_14465, partial [Spirochaetes bacterium]|nr:hypothetical protein [Spirochaetota bacterium]